jgi:Trypsin
MSKGMDMTVRILIWTCSSIQSFFLFPLTLDQHSNIIFQQRDLIINGNNAIEGRYPYFVALKHFCGGVLIAPDIVLTAGHCWFDQHIIPYVGAYNYDYHHLDDSHGSNLQDFETFEIMDQLRHPRWVYVGEDEFIYDYSIIKLNAQSTKQFIRVNRQDTIPHNGQEIIAMGMGNTDPDFDSRPDVLQQVRLNAISNDRCEQSFDIDRNETYQGRIHPSMICTTGGIHNERDSWYVHSWLACILTTTKPKSHFAILTVSLFLSSYDSGSPIIIPGFSAKDDILIGLVSWGELCADPSFPGVNARVSFARDWIDETVCRLSDNPPNDFRCHVSYPTHSLPIEILLGILFLGITIYILSRTILFGIFHSSLVVINTEKQLMLHPKETIDSSFDSSYGSTSPDVS